MTSILLAVVGLGGTVIAGYANGLRLNLSASAPAGIWRISSVNSPVNRGDIVAVCPPDTTLVEQLRDAGLIAADWGIFSWNGPTCASETVPFLKPIVAVHGDRVSVRRQGIAVNGVPLRNSGSADLILGVPAFAEGDYVVAEGQVWLISSYTDHSFDSRYFGPVAELAVRGVAHAVLINGEASSVLSAKGPLHGRP